MKYVSVPVIIVTVYEKLMWGVATFVYFVVANCR